MKKMVQHITAFVLCLVMSLYLLPGLTIASAAMNERTDFDSASYDIVDSGFCGENVSYTFYSDGTMIISGQGSMTDYYRSNETPWYTYRSSIKSLLVDDGVTRIGDYAFSNSAITILTIPESLREIGGNSFSLSALKSLSLPKNVDFIAPSAFLNCPITSVTIEGPADISSRSFADCYKLSLLTINNNLNSRYPLFKDGADVFSQAGYNADGFTVVFGNNVTRIPSYLFHVEDNVRRDCAHITRVIISNSVASIRNYAFSNCYDLTSIEFKGNAPNIQANAFNNVSATAFYNIDDATWDAIINQSYGGNITWIGRHKPRITKDISNTNAVLGKTANFNVEVQGEGLRYQWFEQKKGSSNWSTISNEISAKLTVTATTDSDGAKYRCIVYNEVGEASSKTATLTVLTKPKITTQPKAASVKAGRKVTFKVKATGGELKYQWYYQKPNSKKWVKMSGKTKDTLSFTATKAKNGYKYYCLVKNKAGSVKSKAVKLTVK